MTIRCIRLGDASVAAIACLALPLRTAQTIAQGWVADGLGSDAVEMRSPP